MKYILSILERFVHMHFSTFLAENNLITLVQSGFRHMHSTLTSLINITDRWLRNIDQRLVTGIVFTDLRKAFDKVNVEILLKKLNIMVYLMWSLNGSHHTFMTGMQTLIIDGSLSGSPPVTVRVPPGSILGPLLFTLYVNELPKVAENCLTSMYADDTELEHAIKLQDIQLMETTIKKDLDKLQNYFESTN